MLVIALKKHVVLYKKLSDALMQRLHAHAHVTLIERLDAQGLEQLRVVDARVTVGMGQPGRQVVTQVLLAGAEVGFEPTVS